MSSKSAKFIVAVIIVVLLILNINKYRNLKDEVVPVWSSYDEEYYYSYNKNSLYDRIKSRFSLESFIYSVSKVRLQVPITYLKREILLLGYYTPEELKSQTETIYTPVSGSQNVIKLKFNLADNTGTSPAREDSREGELIDIQGKRTFLAKEAPLIAIYHTHTSETYMDDPRKQDGNGHVLQGNIGNVGKVGMELARVLSEKYGFRVIHTTKVHDEIYNRSYYNSRNTVKQLLQENPDIDLILDIHRDGIKAALTKEQLTAVFGNERAANIMIVVANGKYSFGEAESRNDWQKNLALARELADWLDRLYPGLLRRIEERDTTTNRYNQDLSPVSLLIEIGDYRNTTQEAINAAHYLADAIAAMFGRR